MGAIVAATLTAAGTAIVAALQARTLCREADVLRTEWNVETGFRLPNLRRDRAQSTVPAPAGLLRRASAKAATLVRARSKSLLAPDEADETLDAEADGKWSYESSLLDDEADTLLEEEYFADMEEHTHDLSASNDPARESVSPDALEFAPFLLDTTSRAAWAVLLGLVALFGLIGPQVAPGATQLGALLIPLSTLALASLFPIPWAWAALGVGLLQGANAWGYALAGGTFQAGDAGFCVAMYLANAAAVALIAAHTMRRHRRWIVMRAE